MTQGRVRHDGLFKFSVVTVVLMSAIQQLDFERFNGPS